ncbi:phosphatidate cytidylyltransferase, putative [Entamoeba histolytica HM-1:IMSS-B]|uniref:Phosphatidate cytidylyltransferase, putative n=6 Tax=Entamoeba histolytica TaxID=5759 RepID=C4M2J4_ENTH1|nr:phosphatidate cytidylyltransferase, putative [Entamoeba histolytica HM-1:IMSS]EMD47050.1 phosphatidate cytidylyltransferase, putative [Entamoeba histolytica KU27]EMH74968.1 phosphatidate cytidylyltransferase, putative [Entamoeba histolytica HM-1:IMSS-B]EMS13651.1 phosphatidate cytidylyltransferase, putative [Entamoeba histolytica HM-3:IMSS]ENY64446.1 phosphatidate cytidylyltransferase, putative [Entamoeba histolytica HM-1:IMSS-A]GAT95499.1 phosphatidate cytidylyltransferase putative [Entamo|eukprot:XP_652071.1 phosphatidate cytidylyltransferase, putative [Entamoeba histolytica HM-1:IMSS]
MNDTDVPTKAIPQSVSEKITKSETNKKQRIITGTIFSLVAVVPIYLGVHTFHVLEAVLSFLLFHELNNVFHASTSEKYIGYGLFVFDHIMLTINYQLTFEIFPVISFIVYSCYSLKTHDLIKSTKLFFASYWSIHLLSFSIAIPYITGTTMPLMYIIFLTCNNDIWQWAFGRMFGKHKPFTFLSPNKSIEGYLGGLLVLIIIGILAQDNLIFILLVYVSGIIGDLIASCLKRQLDVKDFGSILPGMGGMFDRMDSHIIVITLAYYWYKLFGYHPGLVLRCIQHYFYFTNDECSLF